MNTLFETSGAHFSKCGKYRYLLFRKWDELKPMVLFIGLNPSTANAEKDDPTIKKVCKIAKNLGYGGIYMMNLFALISTDPKALDSCADGIGENDIWLLNMRKQVETVVYAWGNFPIATERAKVVASYFTYAVALKINKNGSPKHPLYCNDKSTFVNYQ